MPGYVYRRAQMRGLLGGSKPWLVLWVILAGRRLVRRFAGDQPEVVLSQPLLPGEALVISNGEADSL